MHSATQILAFQEWKLEFIKMFNDKPLLISVDRSLLSYCTVVAGNYSKGFLKFICNIKRYGNDRDCVVTYKTLK